MQFWWANESGTGDVQENDATVEETVATDGTESLEQTAIKRDLPEGNYEEVGNGTLYLLGPNGSTEDGAEIILYPDMESFPYAYIDYELRDLDGSVLTYIYLDGVEVDSHQIGAGYQSMIPLSEEWQITPGEHAVEAVQYVDNDKNGEISFYRSEVFTVKEA